MSAAWAFQIRDARQAYAGKTVLRVENLDIAQGEVLALVGPTGAGKSTLLRLLAGLEKPEEGSVGAARTNGDLTTLVFQKPLLLSGSVQTNIDYPMKWRGGKHGPSAVNEIIAALGINGLLRQSAKTLSGGQTQLVSLARALVLGPQVLLLDEPTANLDPARVGAVEKVVLEAQKRLGMTIVWATHNLFQARRVSQRVALLLDGKLIEAGPTEAFFESPQDSRTADFVRGKMVY